MGESGRSSFSYQEKARQAYQLLNQACTETVQAMRLLVDQKDSYTRIHSDRVAVLSAKIAVRLGCGREETDKIYLGGLFHDIGKIGIPDLILLKPERLTENEYEIIKEHSKRGERILQTLSFLKEAAPLVRSHHERVDGKGYPDGLAGEEIPLGARIIAVADAFDAMTSKRPYRSGLEIPKALIEIQKQAGTQFDIRAVAAFLDLASE